MQKLQNNKNKVLFKQLNNIETKHKNKCVNEINDIEGERGKIPLIPINGQTHSKIRIVCTEKALNKTKLVL